MIHLDCKTEYSFMRGYGSVEKWVARAKEIGAPAIGISDWCSTWGHVPFSKSDINVLYGVQVPVVQTLDKEQTHGIITLLAKRDVKVLYDIVTLAHEQTYYRPRIKWSQLAGLGDDIALIVNECPLGQLANIDKLGFGSIAISPVRSVLHRVIEEFSCIATGGPVYPFVEDREGYDLVQAISSGHRIGEDSPVGYHMLSRQEYEAALLDQGIDVRQGWFDNAEGIVASCNAQIPRASLIHVEGDILELAKQNAKRLGIDLNGPYGDRLQHEVSIIREKNFESYFLFVSDLVNWAKDRMLVGPGRGSAGGSLLCFLLGITDVDPLVHGTLFERFLDPTRSDYPDIDVDFPDNKRELVFTYLGEKYGKDRVARLGTISRFGGKSAITDAGKAFGMSLSIIRDINKLWDAGNDYLAPFFAQLSKDLLEKHPYIVKASLLEDVPRHSGVHAAGVCITSEPISNFGPIDRNGTIALDLHTAESVGLIKMDALGLRTLAVLDAVGHPMPKTFDDPKVWEIFNNDKVTGVFQFEGQAVRGLDRGGRRPSADTADVDHGELSWRAGQYGHRADLSGQLPDGGGLSLHRLCRICPDRQPGHRLRDQCPDRLCLHGGGLAIGPVHGESAVRHRLCRPCGPVLLPDAVRRCPARCAGVALCHVLPRLHRLLGHSQRPVGRPAEAQLR